MTLKEFEKENMYNNRSEYEMESEYYGTSHFNSQKSGKHLSNDNE
jgi:hypothetical protein